MPLQPGAGEAGQGCRAAQRMLLKGVGDLFKPGLCAVSPARSARVEVIAGGGLVSQVPQRQNPAALQRGEGAAPDRGALRPQCSGDGVRAWLRGDGKEIGA